MIQPLRAVHGEFQRRLRDRRYKLRRRTA
jgi:hypothetical protein